jgi:hypothetical protein
MKELMETGQIDRLVEIERAADGGRHFRVYDGRFELLC